MSSGARTPKRPDGPPPTRRKKSINPKFKNRGTELSDKSNLTPIEDVFPTKNQVRQRKKRATGDSDTENPIYAGGKQIDKNGRLRAPLASMGKLRSQVQKGSNMFSKGFNRVLADSSDSDFDPDDVEDIDYSKRIKDIENLPYYEALWAKKVPGRCGIAITAVSLIWITSFAIISAIVSDLIFPSKSFSELETDFINYFEVVNTQREGYENCAQSSFDECKVIFDNEVLLEETRTQTLLSEQEAFLVNFELARFTSKTNLNDTLNAFIDLTANGGQESLVNFAFSDADFNETCPRVANILITSLSSVTAITRVQNLEDLTNEALQNIILNFQAQDNFTKQFWDDKNEEIAAFNAELANLYADRSGNITSDLNDAFADVSECFQTNDCNGQAGEGLQSIFDDLQTTIDQDTAGKNGELQNVNGQAEDLLNAFGTINGGIDEFNGQSPFSIPVNTDLGFTPDFEIINEFTDTTGVNGGVDATLNKLNGKVDELEQEAADSATTFRDDAIGDNFEGFEKYEPPTLSPDAADLYAEQQAQRTKDLTDTVGGTGGRGDNEDDFFEPSPKQSDPTQFLENNLTTFLDRDLEFFAYDASVFNNLEVGFNNFLTVITSIDILVRIVMTIMTWNKYWKLSKIGKPPGDARVKALLGQSSGVKATKTQKLAKQLTHPAVLNGLAMLFTVLIVSLAYKIYEPFYESFIEGCRDNDVVDFQEGRSDGTMIFRNLAAAAITFATQSGDAIIQTSVDTLNTDREVVCERNTIETVDRTENNFDLFFAIKADFENTLSFRNEIIACIDLVDFDLTSGTGFLAQPALNDPSFDFVYDDTLESGIFDCNSLSLCNIAADCNFTGDSAIEEEAFVVGCDGEQFLHSSILSFLIIMIIYVTMFIFRKNFMRALVRLFWREINPYDFNILATCVRDGQHIDPETVSQDGNTFQDAATLALHKAIGKWERESWLFLFASISLHFPWIFMAIFLRQGFH